MLLQNKPIKDHLKSGNISGDTHHIKQSKSVILLENDVAVKANTIRDAEGRYNETADNIHQSRSKFHVPLLNAKLQYVMTHLKPGKFRSLGSEHTNIFCVEG